jgi:hypothetical protein
MDLFEHAKALRDEGMATAYSAQKEKQPDWGAHAYAAIVTIARTQPTVHIDDVLATINQKPHHANAWGSVWMRAIKNRVIERTGMTRPCETDPKKHAHQYPVYRSLLSGAAQ